MLTPSVVVIAPGFTNSFDLSLQHLIRFPTSLTLTNDREFKFCVTIRTPPSGCLLRPLIHV